MPSFAFSRVAKGGGFKRGYVTQGSLLRLPTTLGGFRVLRVYTLNGSKKAAGLGLRALGLRFRLGAV